MILVFTSANKLKTLEALVNAKLEKVKKWCDVNKLMINMAKINFMIIMSAKKDNIMPVNIQIRNKDGTCHSVVGRDDIKYIRVMIDDCSSWKYHILYICS